MKNDKYSALLIWPLLILQLSFTAVELFMISHWSNSFPVIRIPQSLLTHRSTSLNIKTNKLRIMPPKYIPLANHNTYQYTISQSH